MSPFLTLLEKPKSSCDRICTLRALLWYLPMFMLLTSHPSNITAIPAVKNAQDSSMYRSKHLTARMPQPSANRSLGFVIAAGRIVVLVVGHLLVSALTSPAAEYVPLKMKLRTEGPTM